LDHAEIAIGVAADRVDDQSSVITVPTRRQALCFIHNAFTKEL
jgi:hypothetical protein